MALTVPGIDRPGFPKAEFEGFWGFWALLF
jgi:hypothetical protein